jgi:hypothetical protein
MTKPNKSEISDKLKRWAKLQRKRLAIEAKRDQDLDPHVTRFEKATAAINANAKLQIDDLTPQIDSLAKDIETALLAGVDEKTGVIALAQVSLEGGKALAEVKSKEGARVVDPETFFKTTAPAKRTNVFWSAVKIAIAPAEAFLGKIKLNEIAEKPTTYKVELKLGE